MGIPKMKAKTNHMNRKITKPKLGLGQQLHAARERLGVNLEEASHALHIPLRQLEALETDSAARVFPAPVYAFGALRAYAAWLGVESRSLERILAAQLRSAQAERSKLEVHTLPYWYELISARTVVTAAGIFIALIVGSYVVWQVRTFWRLPQLEITEPQESVLDADRVTISGSTEAGTHVRINEQPVALQDSNHFEQEVPLSPGVTIVRIEAENVAGRVRLVEKHLLRPANAGTLK